MRKFLSISTILSFLILSLFALSSAENITITTFYPSPYGNYRELRVSQMSVGNAYTITTAPLQDGYLIVASRLGVGLPPPANPATTLDVRGDAAIRGGQLLVEGDVTSNNNMRAQAMYANAFNISSDLRLKDIVSNYSYGLNAVKQLNVVNFTFKKDNPLGLPSDKPQIGLIAQEIQKVIPEAIETDKKGYLSVNTTQIVFSMLNAIKEQQNEIELLRQEINELKIKVKK